MNVTPPGQRISNEGQTATRSWVAWVSTVSAILTGITASGTTANRPTSFLWVGRAYFDTTLGQPIWYDGSGWVDSAGSSA